MAPIPSDLIELRLEAVHSGTGATVAVDLEHDDGHFTALFDPRAFRAGKEHWGAWRFEVVVRVGETERRAPFGSRLGGPLQGKPRPRQAVNARRRRLVVGYTEPGKQLMLSNERRFNPRRLAGAALRRAGLRGGKPREEAPTAVRIPMQVPREAGANAGSPAAG
jgi:hypothetical protein